MSTAESKYYLIRLGRENFHEWAASLEVFLRRTRMWVYTHLEVKAGEDDLKWRELADIITLTLTPEVRPMFCPEDFTNGQKLYNKIRLIYLAQEDFFIVVRLKLEILDLKPKQFPSHRQYLVEFLRIQADIRHRNYALFNNPCVHLGISLALSMQDSALADQYNALEKLVASGQLESAFSQAVRTGHDVADQWVAEKARIISRCLREENERKRQVRAGLDSDTGGVAVLPAPTLPQHRRSKTVRFSVSNPEGVPTDLMEATIEEDTTSEETPIPGRTKATSPPHESRNIAANESNFKYNKDYLMQFQPRYVNEPSSDWPDKIRETIDKDCKIFETGESSALYSSTHHSPLDRTCLDQGFHKAREEREYGHLFSSPPLQVRETEPSHIPAAMSLPVQTSSPESEELGTVSDGDNSVATMIHRPRITYDKEFLLQFQYQNNGETSGKFLQKIKDVIGSTLTTRGRPPSIMTNIPATPLDSTSSSRYSTSRFPSAGMGSFQAGYRPYYSGLQGSGPTSIHTAPLQRTFRPSDQMAFSPGTPVGYRNSLWPPGYLPSSDLLKVSPYLQQGPYDCTPTAIQPDTQPLLGPTRTMTAPVKTISNPQGEYDNKSLLKPRLNPAAASFPQPQNKPIQALANYVDNMARDLSIARDITYTLAGSGGSAPILSQFSFQETPSSVPPTTADDPFVGSSNPVATRAFSQTPIYSVPQVSNRVRAPSLEVQAISENWKKELERQNIAYTVPGLGQASINLNPAPVPTSNIRRTELTLPPKPPAKQSDGAPSTSSTYDSTPPQWKPRLTSTGSPTPNWIPTPVPEMSTPDRRMYLMLLQSRGLPDELDTIYRLGWPYPPSIGGAYQKLKDMLEREVGKNRGW